MVVLGGRVVHRWHGTFLGTAAEGRFMQRHAHEPDTRLGKSPRPARHPSTEGRWDRHARGLRLRPSPRASASVSIKDYGAAS